MALESDNVRVGVTGAVYVAPLGTTVPTTAEEALNAAFVDLGYMDENGIAEIVNQTVTNIRAWQNSDIVRKVQTEHDYTLGFTPLETNPEVLEQFYGSYTDGPDGVVEISGGLPTAAAWVIDVVDGTGEIRIVVPNGQLTERGQVNYVATDATKYPMTITAYPDADGVKAYQYHNTVGAS
jgi:hypothetical protein